jgi:hypothetical protein
LPGTTDASAARGCTCCGLPDNIPGRKFSPAAVYDARRSCRSVDLRGHGLAGDYFGCTVTVKLLFAGCVSVPVIATVALLAKMPAAVALAENEMSDCCPTAGRSKSLLPA